MSRPADRLSHLAPIDRYRRQAEETERLQVGNQLNIDADRAMRSLAVGTQTGLAYDLIYDNLEELEEELKKTSNFDPDAWKRESPGFAEYAAENPFHLSVLKMDNENLTKWERNTRAMDLALDSTWAKLEYNKIGARRARGREHWLMSDEAMMAEYEKLMQPHSFGAESWWAKAVVFNAKEVGPMFYSTLNAWDEMLIGMGIGAVAGGVITSPAGIPTGGLAMLGGIVSGGARGAWYGWNVGLARGGYEMLSGESYNRYIEAGFTHENAAIAAKAAGAIGAVVEPFGINMLFKYIPGARQLAGKASQSMVERMTGSVLRKRGVLKSTGMLAARYGEVMASEIMVEIIQDSAMTVGQNILASIENKPDQHITIDMWQDQMGETIVHTARAVTLLAGFGPGLQYMGDIARARNSRGLETAFKAIGEAARDSELKKAVPGKFKEFVEKVTAKGAVKKLYIDIEKFKTYFQDKGLDPNKVARELEITSAKEGKPSTLEELEEMGEDIIEIETAIYADKMAATEHHDPLSADLKPDPEIMSTNERKEFLENASAIEKAYALGEPPPSHVPNQEILDRVRNDLMANAGHDFSAATKLARLEEYRYSVAVAEEEGLDLIEFFNATWGGVQREIDTMGEAVDVDMNVDPLLDLLRAEKGPKQRDIYGQSLIEFLISKGGLQDQGGELSAQDVQLQVSRLVQDAGMTLDEAAEAASEAGFIAAYDQDLLLSAVMREVGGTKVFGRGADLQAADIASDLDQLQDILDQAEIDIQAMSNVEIRKQLAGTQKLYQRDVLEMPGVLPDNILPEQDFGDLQIVRPTAVAGAPDGFVGLSQPAQTAFQDAVDRLRGMQELLECVNAT